MIKRNGGFTLVEMLIAVAVGMVILGAVYAVFNTQNKILGDQEQIAELHQNARIAMDMMVREISMAGYNQTTNPAVTPAPRCTNTLVATAAASLTTPNCAGIIIAGSNTITFSMDITDTTGTSQTPDGLVDGPNEYITYSCYSSSGIPALGRKSKDTASIQPVVEYVESLNFIYDSASLADIRKVKITICTRTSKPDPNYTDPVHGDHFRRYCLSSFAYPRNMGLNTASTTTPATTSTVATTTVPPTTTIATTTVVPTTKTTTVATSVQATTSTVETTVMTIVPTEGSTITGITQSPPDGEVANNSTVTVCAIITDSRSNS